MSYFICIAVPHGAEPIESVFPGSICCADASDSPFGQATCGTQKRFRPYVVTSRGCSTDIVDRGPKKNRCSGDFVGGVSNLLQRMQSISFLIHIARGDVRNEGVSATREESLAFGTFAEKFPAFEPDVRYVVRANSTGGDSRHVYE